MIALLATAWAGTLDAVVARRSDDGFVAPTAAERLGASALAADLARAAPSSDVSGLVERARRLGFELAVAEGVAVLADADGALRGAGVLAVRLGPLESELVLQAPHPFDDLHTGRIAAALFDAGGVRALMVATAARDAGEGADPAHAPASWFQATTDGLAIGLSRPWFVQLHGFAATTSDACAVVSEGPTRVPAGTVERIGLTLGRALDCAPVRTGAQEPALAARTNVQGQLLIDRAPFLHVELALPVRQALADEADRRARLLAWLARIADGEVP